MLVSFENMKKTIQTNKKTKTKRQYKKKRDLISDQSIKREFKILGSKRVQKAACVALKSHMDRYLSNLVKTAQKVCGEDKVMQRFHIKDANDEMRRGHCSALKCF